MAQLRVFRRAGPPITILQHFLHVARWKKLLQGSNHLPPGQAAGTTNSQIRLDLFPRNRRCWPNERMVTSRRRVD